MMASRKAVLDQNKQQLLDSVNASNKIYTNEELSILLSEQREKLQNLELVNQNLSDTVNTKNDKIYNGYNSLKIYNEPYGGYYQGTQKYIVMKLGDAKFTDSFMMWIRFNIYQYDVFNQIVATTYFYQTTDNFYSPASSFLQKSKTFPIYFGRDSNMQTYLILDIMNLEYVGVWIDHVAVMYGNNHSHIESGWNIYRTNDISNMTLLSQCRIQ